MMDNSIDTKDIFVVLHDAIIPQARILANELCRDFE